MKSLSHGSVQTEKKIIKNNGCSWNIHICKYTYKYTVKKMSIEHKPFTLTYVSNYKTWGSIIKVEVPSNNTA